MADTDQYINAGANAAVAAIPTSTAKTTKKKRKVYDEEVDGFAFTRRSKRLSDRASATAAEEPAAPTPVPAPVKQTRPKPQIIRQKQPTQPSKPSTSPNKSTAVTTPVRRKAQLPTPAEKENAPADEDDEGDRRTTRIRLPFQETPVIRRNKEMRKTRAEGGGSRRSSTGMRGRRASSLIDEGRSGLPHAEVPSSEFYKHISADIPEPRRMRCLLGWCGARALAALKETDVPVGSETAEGLEEQAVRTARIVHEELAQELITNGSLSDWFSRSDDTPTQNVLRKKPNPRNLANAAKAEELERELERLKQERTEWDALIASATAEIPPVPPDHQADQEDIGELSPLNVNMLDSSQRAIYEQLQQNRNPNTTDPSKLQDRLRHISENLEFTVDQFAHGVHVLVTTRETGDRLAEHTLAAASDVLAARERERRAADNKPPVDPMMALRGLAKVLNG